MPHPIERTCLFMLFTLACALVAIGLPVVIGINDAIDGFNTISTGTFADSLRAGNAVYGVAPVSGRDGCKSFHCQEDYVALRSPFNASSPSTKNVHCICVPNTAAPYVKIAFRAAERNASHNIGHSELDRRGEVVEPLSKETNFTFVPPPKTDITPELLAQSLSVQPQDTATVGSIMPHFQDGVISFGVQLNGLVASTMTLNASTSLPCAKIGAPDQAQPDLILRPKDIENGTTQVIVPDCHVIAVNMYDPNLINYWVMDPNGSIFSLMGNNKLMNINQLNSTASTSLVLRTQPAGSVKRDIVMTAVRDSMSIIRRALSQPDLHTASMTAEACAAMKCNNNGGQPAVFNPFTKTCWCKDPVYAETETS